MTSTVGRNLLQAWHDVVAAHERDDDTAGAEALRRYIGHFDEAFWARDFEVLPEIYDADVSLEHDLGLLGFREYRGVDAFTRWRDDAAQVLAGRFFMTVEEVRFVGNRVLGVGVVRTRGRFSGTLMRRRIGVVWTIRDGRITRAQLYLRWARAAEEVGLDAATLAA